MRLIILYGAQMLFIIAAFAAVSSVFVSINSSAIQTTVSHLIDETCTRATERAAAPLVYSAGQLMALADTMTTYPKLQAVEPVYQWLETPSSTNTLYPKNETITAMLITLRNTPYAQYVFEVFPMPDNASQWVDYGVGREAGDTPSRTVGYNAWRPSYYRDPITRTPDGVVDYFNITEMPLGAMAPTVWTGGNVQLIPNLWDPSGIAPYQQSMRDGLTPDDRELGKYTLYTAYVDPTAGLLALLVLAVPLQFSADPRTGSTICSKAVAMDIDARYLSRAITDGKEDGVDLALFYDLDGSLVAWTLDRQPADLTNEALLIAGTTGSYFDDALTAIHGAGWCLNGSETFFGSCVAPDPTSVVTDSSRIYTLRRVEHINARFSVVIVGDQNIFYGPGNKARTIGIAVSVATCVICMATCLLLWWATVQPLNRLVDNMQIAATFATDVQPEFDSCIAEVQSANTAFLSMHDQLQQAKPFIPRHLLNELDYQRRIILGHDVVDDPDVDTTVPTTRNESDRHSTRSTVLSRRSKAHTASTQNASAMLSTGAPPPLEQRIITTLVMNVVDFHAIAHTATTAALQANFSTFLSHVLAATSTQRGVIDTVQGDCIIATFNSSSRCGHPAAKAVQSAFSIRRALLASDLPREWCRVSFGIATGHALCGTIGSADLRAHASIGRVVRHAISMQRVSRMILGSAATVDDGWCVATAAVARDCLTFAHYRHLFAMTLPPDGRLQLVSSIVPPSSSSSSPSNAVPHAPNLDADSQEWLYAIGAVAEANPHREANVALEARFDAAQDAGATTAAKSLAGELARDESVNAGLIDVSVGSVRILQSSSR